MKADTLTDKLHAKADADLRKKIKDSLEWIADEIGHPTTSPELEEFPRVQSAITNMGRPKFASMPWFGNAQQVHAEVAFAFLRDKYRNRYVAEFMDKVNGMAAEMEYLGIVVQQSQED